MFKEDKEMIQLKLNLIVSLVTKISESKLTSCDEKRVDYDIYNNEKGSIVSTLIFIDEKGNELVISGKDLDF